MKHFPKFHAEIPVVLKMLGQGDMAGDMVSEMTVTIAEYPGGLV